MTDAAFTTARERMVREQIAARGIDDRRVLEAMRAVPRERFVPDDLASRAYDDTPLPIGLQQTISQPYIVASMVAALGLEGGETVLDVGTGSGYAAAVLGEIAARVFSVERIPDLARRAADTLKELGYDNVVVVEGDGAAGLPDEAPFDGIVVAAGAPEIPAALEEQLAIGGRLVIPVGSSRNYQELLLLTRHSESDIDRERLATVRFVPLLSRLGWAD